MLDVLHVILNLFRGLQVITAVYLCQTRNPRRHHQPLLKPRNVLFKCIIKDRPFRTRPHETQIPLHYAPKLRQFIQTTRPHDVPHTRDARVMLFRPLSSGLLRIGAHTAKLHQLKGPPVFPQPFLPIKHGARAVQLHRQGNDRHRYRQHSKRCERQRHIRHPLHQ